jgi:hypothetical protein
MTVIYNMSIDRADKPWIGDRRLTEMCTFSTRNHAAPPALPAQAALLGAQCSSPAATRMEPESSPDVPVIDATRIDIAPDTSAFDAPLSLSIAFTSSAAIAAAHWKLRYMVDMAHARHLIDLAVSDTCDYACVYPLALAMGCAARESWPWTTRPANIAAL